MKHIILFTLVLILCGAGYYYYVRQPKDIQAVQNDYNTAKSNVTGETRIVGGGPLGRIDASSYAILDNGAVAHFAGRVKSRIEHRSSIVGQTASKPPAP